MVLLSLSVQMCFDKSEKKDCPLKDNSLTSSVVYNANVTTENDTTGKNYIGLTEGTFK